MGTLVLRAGHRITICGRNALVANVSNNGLVAHIRYDDGRTEQIVLRDIAVKGIPRMARRKALRERFKAALRARQ